MKMVFCSLLLSLSAIASTPCWELLQALIQNSPTIDSIREVIEFRGFQISGPESGKIKITDMHGERVGRIDYETRLDWDNWRGELILYINWYDVSAQYSGRGISTLLLAMAVADTNPKVIAAEPYGLNFGGGPGAPIYHSAKSLGFTNQFPDPENYFGFAMSVPQGEQMRWDPQSIQRLLNRLY